MESQNLQSKRKPPLSHLNLCLSQVWEEDKQGQEAREENKCHKDPSSETRQGEEEF